MTGTHVRQRWHLLPAALAGALALLLAFAASPAAASKSQGQETARYIVVLKDSVDHPGSVARAQTDQRHGKLGFLYRDALKGYAAVLPRGEIESLRKDPRVDFVTPDHRLQSYAQSIPTGIDRVFATDNEAIDIDGENDRPADVDVAVIDTGVEEHEDLNVFARTDCVVYESEAFKCVDGGGADYAGHGTHVAGTVGAIDNDKGVVGVAPGARLWSVRVYLFANIELFESSAMAGVDWVAAHSDEIEVANMSFGCTEGVAAGCDSLPALEGAITNAVQKGVVFIAAAGNESTDASKTHPASHPDVITVSALADSDGLAGEGNDQLAGFSNFGAPVDVAAPGVDILSTVPEGYEGGWDGTSMAAPHVTGAAAILASKSNPNSKADVEAIRERIVEEGNSNWVDTSNDGAQEPLLDVGDAGVFSLRDEPLLVTPPATNIESKGATLWAGINPNGKATTYQFEYGTTTAYGSIAPTYVASIGSGTSWLPVKEEISQLKPETTYHFRIVATNSDGTSVGKDMEFTTLAADADIEPLFTYFTDGSLEEGCPPVSMEGNVVSGGCEVDEFDGSFQLGAFMPTWYVLGDYDVDFDLVVDRNGDGYAVSPTVNMTSGGYPRMPCDEPNGTVIPWAVNSISPAEQFGDLEMEITVGVRPSTAGAGQSCVQQEITVQVTSVGGGYPTELQQGSPSANVKDGYWYSPNSLWMEWS